MVKQEPEPLVKGRQHVQRPGAVRRIAIGAVIVVVGSSLIVHGVNQPGASMTPQPHGVVAYSDVPRLLAQARTRDPRLRLPHARWFIRVVHGQARIVVLPPRQSR